MMRPHCGQTLMFAFTLSFAIFPPARYALGLFNSTVSARPLPALLAFVIGWVLAAFVVGTAIGVNPILVAFVVIVAILILKILDRKDWQYVVGGLIVGILVSLLIPALAPKFIDQAVMFGLLLFASLRV